MATEDEYAHKHRDSLTCVEHVPPTSTNGKPPSGAKTRSKAHLSGATSPACTFADVLDAAKWLQENVQVVSVDRAVLLELISLIEKPAARGDHALWYKALLKWNSFATEK